MCEWFARMDELWRSVQTNLTNSGQQISEISPWPVSDRWPVHHCGQVKEDVLGLLGVEGTARSTVGHGGARCHYLHVQLRFPKLYIRQNSHRSQVSPLNQGDWTDLRVHLNSRDGYTDIAWYSINYHHAVNGYDEDWWIMIIIYHNCMLHDTASSWTVEERFQVAQVRLVSVAQLAGVRVPKGLVKRICITLPSKTRILSGWGMIRVLWWNNSHPLYLNWNMGTKRS